MMSWHQRQDGIVPFYIRRFFRIAPMFWLGIVFFLALDGFSPRYWAPGGLEWWHVGVTALFLHGWHPQTITSVVPGGWSIAVEMTFYAVFPLIALKCRSFGWAVTSLVFAVVLSGLAKGAVSGIALPHLPEQPERLIREFKFLWFFSQLPVFLVGVAVFHGVSAVGRLPTALASWIVRLAVGLLFVFPFVRAVPLIPNHVVYALCFGLAAFGLATGARSWLVNPALQFIGNISFSAYLWHFAVLEIVDRFTSLQANPFGLELAGTGTPHFVAFYIVVVMVTCGLSIATYAFVERPMIRIGSALARRYARSSPNSTARAAILLTSDVSPGSEPIVRLPR